MWYFDTLYEKLENKDIVTYIFNYLVKKLENKEIVNYIFNYVVKKPENKDILHFGQYIKNAIISRDPKHTSILV